MSNWLDLKSLTETALRTIEEMKHQTGRPKSDFEPRESRCNHCCHDWGRLVTINRNRDYWFRMCNICQDVEWNP